MRFSVLVLTHGNRLPALQRCIAKVRSGVRSGAQTHYQDYEIVVVNNGSQGGTRQYLDRLVSEVHEQHGSSPQMRAVHRPENEGVCARNYGIEVAQGDVIIQVDDDVLVTPRFDEVLLKPYANPEVGATGPHGFYQDQSWRKLIDDRRRPKPGQFADLIMGYCWSWRNLMEPAGLESPDRERPRFRYDWAFNPFWHEESDLQLQIRGAGYHLAVTPQVATHQSLHDWHETKSDGPNTGMTIAKRNFFKLVDKWADKGILMEGPAVGLTGPAPGRISERNVDDFAGKAV